MSSWNYTGLAAPLKNTKPLPKAEAPKPVASKKLVDVKARIEAFRRRRAAR